MQQQKHSGCLMAGARSKTSQNHLQQAYAFMRYLGAAAQIVRKRLGKSQQQLADLLDISVVHLSNIENNKSMPSAGLLEKYRDLSGIDLYVVSWCSDGDVSGLPESVRDAASQLREAWSAHLSTSRS